ncbi:hypothetical protein J6590_085549 [Homalodisca vitripennis]|nr:hypothetical protein J6590_085549 [Homalodisca vitripennis]
MASYTPKCKVCMPTKTVFGRRDQITWFTDSFGFCDLPWRHLRSKSGLEEENFSFDRYTFSLKLQDSTDCFSLCSEPGRNVSPSLDQLIDRSN